MRKYILLGIVGMGLVSCAPEKQGLDKLLADRDSVMAAQAETAKELAKLDKQIAELSGETINKSVVSSGSLSTMDFEHYFTIHGVVETDQNANIFPDAAAKIVSINVKEGAYVIKGQVIASLHQDVMSSSIAELETQLKLAKDAYDKQKRLWDKKIGSEMQFLQAETNYNALMQKLETLKSQKDNFNIIAPFDGYVDEIFAKKGEMAAPQMPFCRMVNLSKMFIEADVSEDYLATVKKGTKVVVEFPSIEKVMVSKVSRVGNFINPNNRTFQIRLELSNTKGLLKPNMLADLKIRDYMKKEALVIAPSLIQQDRKNQEFVYVVDGDKVTRMDITSGMTYGNNTEILAGLTGSEEIIEKGARNVQPGDLIIVKNN